MADKPIIQVDPLKLSDLELSLYENAVDSIKHGIEHYVADADEKRRYKYAILHLSQGIALLLKERLKREHPNFIFSNVATEGKTVDVDTAISRLERIAKVDLGYAKEAILELASLRNKTEHYAVKISKHQVDSIIGRVVPFLVTFTRDELKKSLQFELGEENWQALLAMRGYVESAIRHAELRIRSEDKEAFLCDKCQAYTAVETSRHPREEDEWTLNYSVISCLVCLDITFVRTRCRQCGKEIISRNQPVVQFMSYCDDCAAGLKQEFANFKNPQFVGEVRRWFSKHDSITAEQLFRLLRNVSTAGSSAPSYLSELIDKKAIKFVHDYEQAKYLAAKGHAMGSWNIDLHYTFEWTNQD
jgi:hypothetical protein